MPEATTIYEKLLEAENEKLRDALEKQIIECDDTKRKYHATASDLQEFKKDITNLLLSSDINNKTCRGTRRSPDYNIAVWSIQWHPNSEYTYKRMPMLYPIMKKIWLNDLESKIQAMKFAIKNNNTGQWSIFQNRTFGFAPETEKIDL